jgi:uncharacterized protein YxjI
MLMLFDHTKFVVKSKNKTFSSKKSFQILAEDGKTLATAEDTTGFLASLFGSTSLEVRDAADQRPLFTVGRSGWLLKKDQLLDADGQVIGTLKGKKFSLSGGYHVYDKAGKHIAEIQGSMFKADYKFLTPEKKTMGAVSRTWGGLAQSLFTGDDTYGVQVEPQFAEDKTAKIMMLGAALAVESIFKKAESKGSSGSSASSASSGAEE